jgi:hypothetical protein
LIGAPITESVIFANTSIHMKSIAFFLSILLFPAACLFAQSENLPPLDKSPMDMSYYPNGYPVLKTQDKITGPVSARVIYGRPQKAGRVLFGDLVPYGQLWRMGANEATEIEFFQAVRIGGKKISKGRYTLYAIVNENTWTIIINKEIDTWGAFKYNIKKDILRLEVPVQKNAEIVEALTMVFEKSTSGFNLDILWDTVKVALPVYFIK